LFPKRKDILERLPSLQDEAFWVLQQGGGSGIRSGAAGGPEFRLLDASAAERKQRWATFGMGTALQVAGLALVVWLAVVLPPVVSKNPDSKSWTAHVVLYDPVAPKPAPRLVIPPMPKLQTPKELVEDSKPIAPTPLVQPKAVTPPLVAKARIPEPPVLRPTPPAGFSSATLPKWEPKVKVGAFNESSHAEAKLKMPAADVQTGGFGSPNGLPGHAQADSRPNVAHLGAFDLPQGSGSGNGSGGTHGAQAVVASAGFGNGIAGAPSGGATERGTVQSAGFSDAQAMTQSSPTVQARPAAPVYDPVEITAKPNPVYTAEARRLHIQGEVLVRVVFAASGRLQILGVTRGLGHGLDQAAVQAAQEIQFKPARRNGQPVDTTATLHILFQLAG
jgi:TonB family protein